MKFLIGLLISYLMFPPSYSLASTYYHFKILYDEAESSGLTLTEDHFDIPYSSKDEFLNQLKSPYNCVMFDKNNFLSNFFVGYLFSSIPGTPSFGPEVPEKPCHTKKEIVFGDLIDEKTLISKIKNKEPFENITQENSNLILKDKQFNTYSNPTTGQTSLRSAILSTRKSEEYILLKLQIENEDHLYEDYKYGYCY